MRAMKAVCCAAALVAFLAPVARADEWNKKTYLTFSGPVQVPGITLPAGTYTFELADPDTARHVVRVSSQDGTKHYGLFLTIPNERLEPPSENVVMFAERPAGSPKAIQVWYYPGDRIGEEFVYPRKQAIEIAKATHTSVLSTGNEQVADMNAAKSAKVERVDERGNTVNTTTAAQAPAASARTSDQSVGTAGTSGAPQATARSARRLPRTASQLPSLELLTVLAMAGAIGVRCVRRRLPDAR